jgi:hypothetical protein
MRTTPWPSPTSWPPSAQCAPVRSPYSRSGLVLAGSRSSLSPLRQAHASTEQAPKIRCTSVGRPERRTSAFSGLRLGVVAPAHGPATSQQGSVRLPSAQPSRAGVWSIRTGAHQCRPGSGVARLDGFSPYGCYSFCVSALTGDLQCRHLGRAHHSQPLPNPRRRN